ncbi:MAG: hypothetical protein IPL06_03490 [Betaproteobacteria bacterium]|nr:hypothetical protein [Betaproteobacteria bacterium]
MWRVAGGAGRGGRGGARAGTGPCPAAAAESLSPFIARRRSRRSSGPGPCSNSARLNSVFAFPLSGRAPFLLRWDDFCDQYFAKMEHTGVVKSMKDFYWDIRPKPEYGTIELRVCDTPLSVERAAALACYLQALCSHLLERSEPEPVEDDYLVYNYNRFQACRFGLVASGAPKTYGRSPCEASWPPCAHRGACRGLDSIPAMEHIQQAVVSGSDASYLRAQFAQSGSVEGMVEASLQRFRQSASESARVGRAAFPVRAGRRVLLAARVIERAGISLAHAFPRQRPGDLFAASITGSINSADGATRHLCPAR